MKLKIPKQDKSKANKKNKKNVKTKSGARSRLQVSLNKNRVGGKKEKDKSKGLITYNTTLLDRLTSKISFENLDISSNYSIHDDTAFAKEGYIRVYNIIKYPAEIMYTEERGFLSSILNSLKNVKGFEQDVDFFYESLNLPFKMNFDQKTKRKYQSLERMEKDLRSKISEDSKSGSNYRDREIKQVASDVLQFRLTELIKKKNSYNIIRNNQNAGKTQIETYQFIRMVCKKKNLLDVAEEKLKSRLNSVDIQIKKVKDLSVYNETFSPVSGLFALNTNNDFAPTIFTSDGYSKIRNKPTRVLENELEGLSRLVNVGTDIETFEPLGLSLTSSGQGQNMLILGFTGSGKTYLLESILLNASLQGFKINAMDYKGEEYGPLAKVLPNSITLDFSMDSPYFINTLKFIPELYEKRNWKKEFANNMEISVTGLRILAGIEKSKVRKAENALENLIKSVYAKYGVYYDDSDTYYKTIHVDYFKDIGEKIPKLFSDKTLHKSFGQDICMDLYAGLSPYFSTSSHRSYKFSKEIDLREVLEKDNIFYSFNMNKETEWSSLTEYKIFNLDYVSNLFIQKNKKGGFTTLNTLEEYQRAINSDNMRSIYNSKLSGGRSDSVVNIVLTNTAGSLLSKQNDVSAIRENMTNICVGKLKDLEALTEFCRTYGLEHAYDRILSLQKKKYTFYINYDTGVQRGERLISAIHPDYISRYFETKKIDRQ